MCAVVKALYSKSYLYHNVDMLHVRVFIYIHHMTPARSTINYYTAGYVFFEYSSLQTFYVYGVLLTCLAYAFQVLWPRLLTLGNYK